MQSCYEIVLKQNFDKNIMQKSIMKEKEEKNASEWAQIQDFSTYEFETAIITK